MKLALRYIPTEVWVDVICYPWISRKRLGKIVHKFRNRYFAEILQYCLHERGKRTLGTLILNKKTLPDIPRAPMPENIKFFERIIIWHFDLSGLTFLRNFTLFNDMNLRFKFFDDLCKLRTIFDHLSPLLHGVHSMAFSQSAIPLVQQYFGPKLAQIKMLSILFDFEQPDQKILQSSINFCLNWLILEERDSTEPRFLKVWIRVAENIQQFSTAVRRQFLLAKTPRTFAIEFFCYGHVDNFHLENTIGEQLDSHIVEATGYGYFQIYRHKVEDFAREQLQEWIKKTTEKSANSNIIEIYEFTTIGQIDANAGINEVADNAGKENDQPSTSKKPKMT